VHIRNRPSARQAIPKREIPVAKPTIDPIFKTRSVTALSPLIPAAGLGDPHPRDVDHRHRSFVQSSSASRRTAGAAGFFIFSQSRERPER
jgi:hypothetical protein